MRAERPIVIRTAAGAFGFGPNGCCAISDSYRVTSQELVGTLQLMTKNSWYALEDEIRAGYLTLPGGHRVGLSGQIALDKGRVKTIKHASGLNIRIARQVSGSGKCLLKRITRGNEICSTLIVSPPGCGKTTILRDVARLLSLASYQVTIVDERSEIAACYRGVPQLDLGPCVDVLDGCPKKEGILMALRGLAPDVLITDEIGHPEDGSSLADLARAGVKLVTTCHGSNFSSVRNRQWARAGWPVFELAVLLSKGKGPGTIEQVLSIRQETYESKNTSF